MSQYFPTHEVSKSNSIKVVSDLSGYAKEDDVEYLKTKNSIKKYLVFVVENRYFNKTSGTKKYLVMEIYGCV